MIFGNNRARRVAILIFVLIVLNIVDLAFTLVAATFTMFGEDNPIARNVVAFPTLLVCYKAFLILFSCGIFWKLRMRTITQLACWLCVGVYTILAVFWYVWCAMLFEQVIK